MSLRFQLEQRLAQARGDGDAHLAELLAAANDQLRAREARVLSLPGGVSLTPPMLRRALEIVAPDGSPEEEDAVVVVHQRPTAGQVAVFAYAASRGPETAERLDSPSLEERLQAEGPDFDASPRPVARIAAISELRPRVEVTQVSDTADSLAMILVEALTVAFQRGQASPRASEEAAVAAAEDILMGDVPPEDTVPARF